MSSRRRNEPPSEALDPLVPDELFDLSWYLASYPDISAETEDGWTHFVLHGELEGRSPGPDFDPEFYRRTHLALEAERPFTHYVTRGRDLGHVPRMMPTDATQTSMGIKAALQNRLNPILLIGNDARAAGGPLLLLEIARRVRSRGFSPVFLLKQAGPLFERFAELGPTLIADEGWYLPVLGAVLPPDMPILANTAWGALVADQLGLAERSVVLVHEMPDYILANDLLAPIGRAHTVVASMPRVHAELSRLLPGSRIETIVPGLRAPTATRSGERAIRAQLAERFGASSPTFLGAGYADRRKGFDLFLDAARGIAEREPAAVFVWLGDLGSWARELAEAAEKDGLRLVLPGFRPDAGDWYAAADVYLLTSRQDPGPTTVMDAAAVGTPFVGLAADIGLRDLTDVVAASGEFVGSTEELAERALSVARAETPRSRAGRARFIRSHRSLDEYVADLVGVVAGTTPAVASGANPVRRLAVLLRLAMLRRAESGAILDALQAARSSARKSLRRSRAVAPRATATIESVRTPGLVSIALTPGAAGLTDADDLLLAPALALHEHDDVGELGPGDRVWVSGARLLGSLSERTDLQVPRLPGADPWPLIRELEMSAGRVARIRQFDLTHPPRWAAAGDPPPPPRRPQGSSAVLRPSITLAPRGAVRLERGLGVFVHAYYPELVPLIADRLASIDHPHRLYVSTTDEEKAATIRGHVPEAVVRVVPNVGRDIAPKVFGFAREHGDHDVVLHLHTKRSPHRSDLSGWFAYLLDCLLPSPEGVNAILALFAGIDRVGMVSPALYKGLGETASWGPNRAIAEVLTWGSGWPALPEDHDLAFAAGSMFWARSAALRPLQELAIPGDAFSDSGAADGTLAHAVERLIGVSNGVAGFEQVFVAPPRGFATAADTSWAVFSGGSDGSAASRAAASRAAAGRAAGDDSEDDGAEEPLSEQDRAAARAASQPELSTEQVARLVRRRRALGRRARGLRARRRSQR